jgi:hypothetical protein
VWLQRTGELIGCYPRGFDGAYAAQSDVALAATWQRFNFSEPSAVPTRWDDWRSGMALPQVRGEVALVDTRVDTQWTLPPLAWYHEMLRAAYPLTTGTGEDDRAGYPTDPSIQPVVTATVLDYLAQQGPDAIVREVMFDVMMRNKTMAREHGRDVDTSLATAAAEAETRRQRESLEPSLASLIAQGVTTVAGGVVSVVTASPAGIAAAGAVSSAIKLVDTVGSGGNIELRETDIFGRLMPVLDTVGIVDDPTDARTIIALVGLPTGTAGAAPGTYSALGSFIGAAVLASGPLSIVDMPPGGHVEVGQDRAEPSCRWVDDTQRVWRCTIPTGPQWVRVVAPTGEARLARTEASNVAPATLTWGAMFPEHRYRIAGLPPGTEVFVDGSPAMGTWDSDAQAVWDVFMPQGPHDVRLIPPGGAPTLVQVMAQGAASEATWQALVTAGTQRRQQAAAATEGGGGWVLPVMVTLAAGGLPRGDAHRVREAGEPEAAAVGSPLQHTDPGVPERAGDEPPDLRVHGVPRHRPRERPERALRPALRLPRRQPAPQHQQRRVEGQRDGEPLAHGVDVGARLDDEPHGRRGRPGRMHGRQCATPSTCVGGVYKSVP